MLPSRTAVRVLFLHIQQFTVMSQLNAEALLADLAVSAQPCQARRGSLRLDFAHTSGCEQSVRHSNRFAILCARGGGIFSMLDPSECNRRPPPPPMPAKAGILRQTGGQRSPSRRPTPIVSYLGVRCRLWGAFFRIAASEGCSSEAFARRNPPAMLAMKSRTKAVNCLVRR